MEGNIGNNSMHNNLNNNLNNNNNNNNISHLDVEEARETVESNL
jgi:hypothetical protein